MEKGKNEAKKFCFQNTLESLGIRKTPVTWLKNLHDFLEDCREKLQLESKGSVVIAYQKPPLKLKRVGK